MKSRSAKSAAQDAEHLGAVAPPLFLALFEAPRALSEATALWPARRFLERLAPGDGHTVVTIPGFMASERSTRVLRKYLQRWGYNAVCWDLGRNYGVAQGGDLEAALDRRIRQLAEESGGKISLVGWSLGGLIARETARRHSAFVRNVITLGSPLGDPLATSVGRLFGKASASRRTDAEIRRRVAKLRAPIPGVPTTAIYSKSDAVVSWKIAKLPESELVESIGVVASHFGMGFNPAILYLIADRLRQAEGAWQPFPRNGMHKLFFR